MASSAERRHEDKHVRHGSCIGEAGIERALRDADCARHAMQYAVLEVDGRITVMKRPPATEVKTAS